jgi:hypothetical protein
MFPVKRDHTCVRLMRKPFLLALLLTTLCGASQTPIARASEVTIGSPVGGTRISSPILIRAHNIGCAGIRPTSFGYSLDDDPATVPAGTPFDVDVMGQDLAPGTHTVHFKSWTSKGACPVVSTTFTVADPEEPVKGPSIPGNAISSGDLDGSNDWVEGHDARTPGEAVGVTVYPATTPLYDDAREFSMTYSDRAGERWSNSFARDTESTYFALDVYVFIPNPSQILNLEMDINQVAKNGETVIMSTQCSGTHGVWEYGDTVDDVDHWLLTKMPCNPAEWAPNAWHHIQIGEHHDSKGVVTHDWVTLDGVYTPFVGATHESAHPEGWEIGDVNTQFQIEGPSETSATASIYVHNMTVYRW